MDSVERKKEARYSWALDEKDHLVHISVLNRQMRENGELGRYFCPGCNREMRVALGLKNTHYYAHDTKAGCGKETYLHQLAKLKLKEKFDSDSTFEIGVQRPVVCKEYQTCPFFNKEICSDTEPKLFDLKKIYNQCEIEERIASRIDPSGYFQADLLLSDRNGKNPPMLLEIAVTHFVGEIKAEDGQLIIELPVKEEDDIIRYAESPIIEKSANPREAKLMPVFYGPFKRKRGLSTSILNRKSLVRVLIGHRFGIVTTAPEDNLGCQVRHKKMYEDSLLEMNFDPMTIKSWRYENPAIMAYVYALDQGIQITPPRPLSYSEINRARKLLGQKPWEVV